MTAAAPIPNWAAEESPWQKWPPTTAGPPPDGPKVGRYTAPGWMTGGWIPDFGVVEWELAAEHRQRHREAQAEFENASGRFHRGEGTEAEAVAALRELRQVAEAAVYELQAEGAAAPAFASFAEHRARLTPAGAGPGATAAVDLRRFNEAADREAEAHRAFFARHDAERRALKADHAALVHILGPSLNVAVPEDVALLLADPEPAPEPGRAPGEVAHSFAEQAAEAEAA